MLFFTEIILKQTQVYPFIYILIQIILSLTLQSKKKRVCFDTIMDKEALLHIILNDLSEIETLVKSFQGKQDIPEAFINLTERKLSHIADEFSLLKTLTTESSSPKEGPEQHRVQVETSIASENQSAVKIEEEKEAEEQIAETVENVPTVAVTNEVKVEENTTITDASETEEITSTETLTPKEAPEEQVKASPESKEEIRKTEEQGKTIGETLGSDKKSVHDLMATTREPKVQNKLIGKPIKDLTKGLGINDRFLFQRELFGGDSKLMQQTLDQLNSLASFDEAHSFISTNFPWDAEEKVTQTFFNYIKRKFI
jgi:hypothetical protein